MTTAPLSRDELDRRAPVWSAYSSLFLDTEVRWSLAFVASRCAASGYDDETLEEIFWCEVFPLGIGNLHSVAGDWADLSVPDDAFIARAGRRQRALADELLSGWMVRDLFEVSQALVRQLRGEPSPRRALVVDVWAVVCRRFFDEPARALLSDPTPRLLAAKAEGLDLMLEWQRCEPVLRQALDDSEDGGERAAAVRRLLEGLPTTD